MLSFIAVTRCEAAGTGHRAGAGEIGRHFPKFVVGFLVASLLVTLAVRDVSFADDNAVVRPKPIMPITTLRTRAFTFSFLRIGLTTRLRGFGRTGGRPVLTFSAGVVVNIVAGSAPSYKMWYSERRRGTDSPSPAWHRVRLSGRP